MASIIRLTAVELMRYLYVRLMPAKQEAPIPLKSIYPKEILTQSS